MNNADVRARAVGLASGSVWLVAVSLGFATWALLAVGTRWSQLTLVAALLLTGAIAVAGVVVLRSAVRLPISTLPRTVNEQKMGRRFAWVIAAEVLAFMVVNSVAGARGDYAIMPSLNLFIVGVHFIPLAWIFGVPRYYLMGFLFCAIPAGTLLLFSSQAVIGDALVWYVVPSLGCGLIASLVAIAGLREAWRSFAPLQLDAG